MAIELLPDVVQLQDGETLSLFTLTTRTAVIQQKRMSILGESILSSVFIKSSDPGMTLDVKYFDTTTGTNPEDGERFDLNSHAQFTDADVGTTNRILVSRIHNKPICEITVTGAGSIEFGVYVSVRSETASDLTLYKDGEGVDFDDDQGQPVMCVDTTDNTFRFLRCDDEGLLISGSISLTPITEVYNGTSLVAYNNTATLVTHAPTIGNNRKLVRVLIGGDGSGEFNIKINGTTWAVLRNAWNQRTLSLDFNSKLLTGGSDTITVEVTNVSVAQSGSCNYEAYVYLGE